MFHNKSKHLTILIAGLFCVILAQAQESANTSGGDATGSGGSMAFSVGQVIYTTHTGSTGCVAMGVQHAYEIYTIAANDTVTDILLIAFPNPTTENVTLLIKNYNHDTLLYQLFDIEGKLLIGEVISSQQTLINMNSLPAAVYFVNVVNKGQQIIKSFKIIKN